MIDTQAHVVGESVSLHRCYLYNRADNCRLLLGRSLQTTAGWWILGLLGVRVSSYRLQLSLRRDSVPEHHLVIQQ